MYLQVKKYEYKVLIIATALAVNTKQYEKIAQEFETQLNELGADGWELVQRMAGFFFLKKGSGINSSLPPIFLKLKLVFSSLLNTSISPCSIRNGILLSGYPQQNSALFKFIIISLAGAEFFFALLESKADWERKSLYGSTFLFLVKMLTLVQILSIAFNDFSIPVERVLTIAFQCAAAIIVFVHIDHSVSLGHLSCAA